MATDARRRRAARARVRDQRVHVVLGLPAVPGRHRPGPGQRSGPGRRSWTSCGTTSTTRASSSRTPTRYGPRWPRCPAGRTRPAGLHRALDPAVDGGVQRAGRRTSTPPSCGRRPRLVGRRRSAGAGAEFDLVWQSRSGPPQVPWLEPDVNDHLAALAAAGVTAVVVSPIGFVSDHLEVLWDLDEEAAATAARARPGLRPGGDARHRPAVRPDGPRAGRGAHGRRAQARARADGPEPRRLPAGLLPGPAPPPLTEPAVHCPAVQPWTSGVRQRCREGTAL